MVSLVPFRIIIGWPSSLRQVIRGGGCPVARHHSVAFSPSVTERSPLVSSYTISGGTGTSKYLVRNMKENRISKQKSEFPQGIEVNMFFVTDRSKSLDGTNKTHFLGLPL